MITMALAVNLGVALYIFLMAARRDKETEQINKELKELRRTNGELKQKREDIQWVAKSEFDQLKKVFVAQEQELARLKQKPLA